MFMSFRGESRDRGSLLSMYHLCGAGYGLVRTHYRLSGASFLWAFEVSRPPLPPPSLPSHTALMGRANREKRWRPARLTLA